MLKLKFTVFIISLFYSCVCEAQCVYVTISPSDCIKCYLNLKVFNPQNTTFPTIVVFPEELREKRQDLALKYDFDALNLLVAFNDSLYSLLDNGYSRIVQVDEKGDKIFDQNLMDLTSGDIEVLQSNQTKHFLYKTNHYSSLRYEYGKIFELNRMFNTLKICGTADTILRALSTDLSKMVYKRLFTRQEISQEAIEQYIKIPETEPSLRTYQPFDSGVYILARYPYIYGGVNEDELRAKLVLLKWYDTSATPLIFPIAEASAVGQDIGSNVFYIAPDNGLIVEISPINKEFFFQSNDQVPYLAMFRLDSGKYIWDSTFSRPVLPLLYKKRIAYSYMSVPNASYPYTALGIAPQIIDLEKGKVLSFMLPTPVDFDRLLTMEKTKFHELYINNVLKKSGDKIYLCLKIQQERYLLIFDKNIKLIRSVSLTKYGLANINTIYTDIIPDSGCLVMRNQKFEDRTVPLVVFD